MSRQNLQKGFTLVELLVVIAIIGILASVILASLSGARIKSRDARRLSDLKEIRTALELYNDTHQTYPLESEMYPGVGTSAIVAENFIPVMPIDPQTQANYGYTPIQTDDVTACTVVPCPTFVLSATIEGGASAVPSNDTDTDFTAGGGPDCTDPMYCIKP